MVKQMEKEQKEKKDAQEIKAQVDKAKEDQKKKETIKDDHKKLFEEKDKKIAELTEFSQRIQAEMENYKKRCDRDSTEFRKYCHAELIAKLLPILDSFELAFKNTEKKEDFVKGVELIFSQLYDALEKEGLRIIKAKGERFDPYKHEALLTQKTEKDTEDDIVAEELQKGYMFKDKILRYSKVKILKKA
jgi:molecular chaperone GrpE